MKTIRYAFAVMLLLAAAQASAQDKGLLTGGKEWKVVKSEEAPPGTRILFANDGKLTMTFTVDGKPREISGTYAVAGNQLTLKLQHDGRERVEIRTIKKLSETVLITEDKNRKVEELQR